MYNHRKYYL